MQNVKKFGRLMIHLILWVLIAIIAGTLLLHAVYALPAEKTADHMAASAAVITGEGVYPELFSWCTSQLDNYTDAIMLMNASFDSGESAIVQAMTAARPHIEGISIPVEVLDAHYNGDIAYDSQEVYYQYWHGYLLLVKPLLMLMDYSGIRILNTICMLLSLLALLWLMANKGLKKYIVPYLLAFAFVMPPAVAMSLQFSSCYYIMTLGSIGVLIMKDRLDETEATIFLFIGIATAYFDFLTYPIATVGVPAVLYFCLKKELTVKEALGKGIKTCFCWGFGYVTMWIGKWCIGSVLTGYNVMAKAAEKLLERSSFAADSENGILLNIRTALAQNIKFFLRTPATLLLAVVVLILLVQVLMDIRRKKRTLKKTAGTFFPFVMLMILPLLWYAGTANHSSIHCWFTNKALMVSVFAGLSALVKSHDFSAEIRERHSKQEVL